MKKRPSPWWRSSSSLTHTPRFFRYVPLSSRSLLLRCAMLGCAVPCMLCCAVLCCAVLCSSADEDEKTEERRAFKRDFLSTLEARILELRDRGRGVVLVRIIPPETLVHKVHFFISGLRTHCAAKALPTGLISNVTGSVEYA